MKPVKARTIIEKVFCAHCGALLVSYEQGAPEKAPDCVCQKPLPKLRRPLEVIEGGNFIRIGEAGYEKQIERDGTLGGSRALFEMSLRHGEGSGSPEYLRKLQIARRIVAMLNKADLEADWKPLRPRTIIPDKDMPALLAAYLKNDIPMIRQASLRYDCDYEDLRSFLKERA